MSRLILLFILAGIALGSGFVWLANGDPGHVSIAWRESVIEMTLVTALIISLMVWFVLWVSISLLRGGFRLKTNFGRWRGNRALRLNHVRSTRGLIAFTEGHWARARSMLVKVAEKSEHPLIFYLLAARASDELNEAKEVEYYLRKADESTDGATIAVGLTQAELQLKAGQLEQSLATLMRVTSVNEGHPQALKLLVEVYRGLGDWDALQKLFPAIKKYKIYSEAEHQRLQIDVVDQQMKNCSAAEEPLATLQAYWKKQPAVLRQMPINSRRYAEHLIALDQPELAEPVLRDALKGELEPSLISLYGKAIGSNKAKQLQLVEGWLKKGGPTSELLLCAARVAVANEIWGQAKEYYERSLEMQATREAYAELGLLYAKLGDAQRSSDCFKKGLMSSE